MLKTFFGWFTAGWQQLLLGLALVGVCSGLAYIRGHADCENAILAGEAKANAQALVTFQGAVNGMVDKAGKDAFADFDARLATMGKVANTLSHDQEVSHANAQTLATALRGRFTLSPDERLRLECIRRPADARCAAPAAAAVRSAIHQ